MYFKRSDLKNLISLILITYSVRINFYKTYYAHQNMNSQKTTPLLLLLALLFSIGCSDSPTFRIFEKPIIFDEDRHELSLEYMRVRHGLDSAITPSIKPTMVVVHWTAVYTLEATYDIFNPPRLRGRQDIAGSSALNVSAHFLVDRDGTIFRLLPDTTFARHVIGLNHTAIGIENIGGSEAPLTRAQLKANEELIRYLNRRHEIEYVIGHHEYTRFRGSYLWKETDPNYLTEKSDPGDRFMKNLRFRLNDLNFKETP